MTGVWIINGKDVFYNQFSTVTFLCPMRFERYPLDEHICKFKVRSTIKAKGLHFFPKLKGAIVTEIAGCRWARPTWISTS